ncbi:hypothetical protein Q1695_014488 [Nippostrongylus brasiliensis]|nr:hypothetical protein Q1695_014488 [Nippostrongylus brasiliensis]
MSPTEISFSEPGRVEKRGQWGSPLEFLLATIGLTVGLGNVWRFPALAYNNGGRLLLPGAFLFPYFVCAVLFGFPMLYLEMIIGQYTNCGPSMIFYHYMPALQDCGDEMLMELCKKRNPAKPIAFNGTCTSQIRDEITSPFDQYFTNVITKRSNGIDDIGAVNFRTLAALIILWIIVMLILVKGHEYMGKVAYVTSTAPYLIIIILFFRGVTLEGATDGVHYYLGKPDYARIFKTETWSAALIQICFSLNVGYGGIIVLASYNERTNNCFKDAWIVISGVLVMSVFGGVAVFAILGYLSNEIQKPIDEVVSSGLSLAFVAYPQAMAKMPWTPVWAAFFFGMLFFLGISSEVAFAETICTSIYDSWPRTRQYKWFISLCCCIFMAVWGLIMTTESGFFWFTIFDEFCASTSACVVITLEVLLLMYSYGYSQVRQDVIEMLGEPSGGLLSLIGPSSRLWQICWMFISPAFGICIMIFTVMRDELTVMHRYEVYRFPTWAIPLRTMFSVQPSLISYNRVMGISQFGHKPKGVEPGSDEQSQSKQPERDNNPTHTAADPAKFQIYVGNQCNNPLMCKAKHRLFTAKNISYHQLYDPCRDHSDIAIITLEETVSMDEAHPICLATEDLQPTVLSLTAVGYGKSPPYDIKAVNMLRGVVLQYWSENSHLKEIMTKTTNKSICQGDSGGPLVVSNKQGKSATIGISFGTLRSCSLPSLKGIATIPRERFSTDWERVMQERSLGPEVVRFCPALELYLSPLSRIEITIKLPKFTIPGQSISNWDLMERLKKGVAPIEFCSLRVTESSLEGVTLEADLSTRRIMKQAVKVLETLTVKVSGFSDPVRVHATEAKSEFPSRHDWDLFFMKNKLDESKPGERPDTIYIAKVPIKWFSEKGSDLPSEALLKAAMETFGKVRRVDIPACDEHRKEMDPEISGIKVKGFVFGPELFFEAYVQYEEYSGFVDAMDTLRNMKWTKRIDEKVFHANVKVDFDRSRHLSDANIRRRDAERARINAEKRRLIEEEKRKLAEQEAEARRILEEKEMRREERERKRKEKAEAERLRKEEEKRKREEEERLARERAEARHRAYDERVKESERFLELVFAHIQHKEDRRQKVQEARLRAEQRAAELEDIPISDKEKYLRSMLLRQREIRMREEEIQWEEDCTPELEAIIENINKIDKFLTRTEIPTYVDDCFSSANPLYVVPLLVSKLSGRYSVERTLYWLTLSFRGLERCLKDSVSGGLCDSLLDMYVRLISSLASTRDKLLNALNPDSARFKTPDGLRVLESLVCSAVTSSLQHTYESVLAARDVDLRVLAQLIARGRTVAIAGTTLLLYAIRWLCSRDDSPIWDRIAQRIFNDNSMSTRDAEALILEATLAATQKKDLMRCFGLTIRTNSIIYRVCCTKLFLQRICQPSLIKVLADYLHTAVTKDAYVAAMKEVVSVWSDPAHVRYVAVEQQMHLTRILLGMGRWANEMELSPSIWQELFNKCIQGVEIRLANPDVIIRQSGMFVGETFSSWMGGDKLEFEYEDNPWLTEMRSIRDGVEELSADSKDEQGFSELPEFVGCTAVQLPAPIGRTDDGQPVDSDDEDFPAYEVPESEKIFEVPSGEDEPDKMVPPPNYIGDCFEQLNEKEKYEVFEAAFFALNGMIRRKALGFTDIASKLVYRLVYLEDKFSTKNFEEIRKQCIVSCLVMCPKAAPELGDIVFTRSASFFHRYLILECFVAAAKELSEFPTETVVTNALQETKKAEPTDWRAIVDARIRSHTRRFTSEAKPERKAPNRFAPVATLFFYPLLRTETGEHLELKGRDSAFLARLIFCSSDILQKAANAPSVVKMANSLADLVAPLRFHPESFIRSSVLFAYWSISVAVPDNVFFELFGNVVRGWLEWITMCADDVNSSEQSRNLARAVAAALLQKLEALNTVEASLA